MPTMAARLVQLKSGHYSLELETSDMPLMEAAIRKRYDVIDREHYPFMSAYRFGGCEFTFANEHDDPCLISGSRKGDKILKTLHDAINGEPEVMAEDESDWLPDWALKAFYVMAGIIVFPNVLMAALALITGYQANPPPGYVKVHIYTGRFSGYDTSVAPWIASLYNITCAPMFVLGVLIVIGGIAYAFISALRRAQP